MLVSRQIWCFPLIYFHRSNLYLRNLTILLNSAIFRGRAIELSPNAIISAPVHATEMNDASRVLRVADIPLFRLISEPDIYAAVTFFGLADRILARDMDI